MSGIKFGTDGWRAVIADQFTFENVTIVSQAVVRWIEASNVSRNGVVIGYDARFLSEKFARQAACVFAELGIPVRFSTEIVPTPAISSAAKKYNAVGIVITASHNPPEYNGYKIKAPYGGSASQPQIREIEKELPAITGPIETRSFEAYQKLGLIRIADLKSEYLETLRKGIDIGRLKESGLKIAHDPMHGAGSGVLKELLGEDVVVEINGERNPLFGGQAPEPVESKMQLLSQTVVSKSCDLGIANDGDADRIAMVDDKGEFVSSHKILSLLLEYLHKKKGYSGTVVKTFSTTSMLEEQVKQHGLELEVTPIGFKYIAEKIIEGDVLVGGEESGGIAVKGHIPERDGLYIGLLIAEMLVNSGKKLSSMVQELFDEYGMHSYYRSDLHTLEEKKMAMMEYCRNGKLTDVAGVKVKRREFLDGVKHFLENGSWVMVRPSGTEPVLRIYAEAPTEEEAKNLVDYTAAMVDQPEIFL